MNFWPAPAKLNLFLHVVGRRADGYHLLQTVFQFLDFGDEIQFRVTPDGTIRHVDPPRGLEQDELCVRAACLLQKESGTRQGAEIALAKRIPIGGGLGGGSSDAATTLLALNQLWGLDWPLSRLAELGLRLGADVPVFVRGCAAWAEGVGEQLTAIKLDCPWYAVVVPPVQVRTATIFSHPDLTRDTPAITIRDFRAGRSRNDLESVVRRLYPEVDQALTWLKQFGEARMTGSGACLFVAVPTEERARAIVASCPPWCSAFAVLGINQHPIHRRYHHDPRENWGVAKR